MPLGPAVDVADEFELFLEPNLNKQLLRFTTAGSVDDGKSTLIGRLLHDSKAIYEDQLVSVRKSRINRSTGPLDFSLFIDGLRAEREQGITIDVGYRYFATSKRKFIIADTPGHEQYTRNMATGASTADLAVILVDATKGILPQTLRHAYISSLLGVRNVVAAINKMDLVNYDERTFAAVREEFQTLAGRLVIPDVHCIPISALAGDNVVERSERMRWYTGPTLLEYLETVSILSKDAPQRFRFPVQYVIRPDANFRGFAGQIAEGVIRPGDRVLALPSGRPSHVESIVTHDGSLAEAFAPMSVTLTLADEIDLSRGDMLVDPASPPRASRQFAAMTVWTHAEPLKLGRPYLIKQSAVQVRAKITKIRHRVNIGNLQPESAERVNMNDIASVEVEANAPLFFDSYQQNRITGSFIVIDPLTNATLAAGMISDALLTHDDSISEPGNLDRRVARLERHRRHGHHPAIFVIDGYAFAARLERALFDQGFQVMLAGGEDVPFDVGENTLLALHTLGFVLVYESSRLTAEEKARLKAIPEEQYFDLQSLYPFAGKLELVAKALSLAGSLRIPNSSERSWKVL